MTDPAANWYVDPTARHEHRYWDGTSWTDHVSDHGVVTTDPPYLERSAESGPTPGPTEGGRSRWERRWIGVGVLGVLVAIATLLGTAASDGSGLAGRWVSRDYTCPLGVHHREVVEVEQSGHHIVGTKVVGDDCVHAGHVSFEGDVTGKTGVVDVWGSQPNATPSIAARGQRLEVANANHLTVAYANLTMSFARESTSENWWPRRILLIVAAGLIVLAAVGHRVARRRRQTEPTGDHSP